MSDRFSKADLLSFEAELQAVISNANEALARPTQEAKPVSLEQPIGRLSRMDAIQRQQIALAAQKRMELSIALARSAIARIRSGDFGVCRLCGEEIEERRLRSSPSVALCIGCQESREQ